MSRLSSVRFCRNFLKYLKYSTDCCRMAPKRVAAILSPGSEEMEFVITVDVLRRGGVNVEVVGLHGSDPVKCSRDVCIIPDTDLASICVDDYDGIVLPGGLGGAEAMIASQELGKLLKEFETKGKVVAAICAAPTALAAHSIGLGKRLTSYPAMKPDLVDKYKYDDENIVVQDGQLVTSRGPGTAQQFGLKLVHVFVDEAKAIEVAKAMLLEYKNYN